LSPGSLCRRPTRASGTCCFSAISQLVRWSRIRSHCKSLVRDTRRFGEWRGSSRKLRSLLIERSPASPIEVKIDVGTFTAGDAHRNTWE
jgi:hypothetical protein